VNVTLLKAVLAPAAAVCNVGGSGAAALLTVLCEFMVLA
jgi:hypothetical protein